MCTQCGFEDAVEVGSLEASWVVFGVYNEWLSLIWLMFGLCFAGDVVVCGVEDVFDVLPVPATSN